jgi:predicted TIM-barrel fold metal-dependent hydrolase
MRIIDAHAHIIDHQNYPDHLLNVMDQYNIEKACISGLGKLFMCVDNDRIKKLIDDYPNRFIGAYFIRPGKSHLEEIYTAKEKGFQMLKVTIPTKPYNDNSFFPLWEAAQQLEMPILFHTGVVTLPRNSSNQISSWNMHPMRLEPISNAFPELDIIIAHLGVHWNLDAAELIRMKKNVYADLTGEPDGWRVRADNEGMKKYLWWAGAFKKIVFGTDVLYNKIGTILEQDKNRLEKYNIKKKTQKLIFSGNIINMLNID